MIGTRRLPSSFTATTALVVVLLTVLGGCEAVGLAGEQTSSPDSITIVNEASETVFVVPIEKKTAQLAFLGKDHPASQPPSGPEDPRLLRPKEEVTVGLEEVFPTDRFEDGDDLFVQLKAYRVYGEYSGYYGVGAVIVTWEELEKNSFEARVMDKHITD